MMIQARTPARALELINQGLKNNTDAFGWQLEQLEVCYHTEDVFRTVLAAMGDHSCYVTNYRDHLNEGRDAHILADELVLAAQCGAKRIDVMGDMFCPTQHQMTEDPYAVAEQKVLIDRIHAAGAQALISSHTYCFLPMHEVLHIAQLQLAHGADIVKIVTAANNEAELLHNFEITTKLKQTLSNEFLFLCVGSMCHTHRRLAPLMAGGMFLCVAEHDKLATPAQPLLTDARILIDTVFHSKGDTL